MRGIQSYRRHADILNPLPMSVPRQTPGKVNIAGFPTCAMPDRCLHSGFVACGMRCMGRLPDSPTCHFTSCPENIICL